MKIKTLMGTTLLLLSSVCYSQNNDSAKYVTGRPTTTEENNTLIAATNKLIKEGDTTEGIYMQITPKIETAKCKTYYKIFPNAYNGEDITLRFMDKNNDRALSDGEKLEVGINTDSTKIKDGYQRIDQLIFPEYKFNGKNFIVNPSFLRKDIYDNCVPTEQFIEMHIKIMLQKKGVYNLISKSVKKVYESENDFTSAMDAMIQLDEQMNSKNMEILNSILKK